MDKRKEELLKLRSYTEEIDKDLTMILQSLQWDRKHILQHPIMVPCKYDTSHKVLQEKAKEHEQECILRLNGYSQKDSLLPEPLDINLSTLIKLSDEDIKHVIDTGAQSEPTFERVSIDTLYGCIQVYPLYIVGSGGLAPQTVGRLQCAYSSDERRAIHDAVVSAAPSCHDLADLALASAGEDDQAPKTKSRTEILAELRDMRRRRTKYRVAAKSRNYSDVLRDVIKTQMELYNEVVGNTKPTIDVKVKINNPIHSDRNDDTLSKDSYRDKHERRGELIRHDIRDKERRRERERTDRYRKESGHDRRDRNRERSREKRKEIKVEAMDEDNTVRDRSRERKHRNKSKEKDYNERRARNHKRREISTEIKEEKPDRESREERTGRRYNECSAHHYRRNNDSCRDLSDGERARNLLTNIKQEIKTVKEDKHENSDSNYTESKHEKHHRDYISKGNGHQRNERDGNTNCKYRHRERYPEKDYDLADRPSERTRDYRKYEEREESYKRKHKKSKDDSGKDRDRSRSNEKGAKKSRVEDKHRMYYEIYSEIDNRRNKL